MDGRRNAPRRLIKEIRKIGAWGSVKYEHHLECGHIEIAARASRAVHLGCSWCVKAEDKEKEMRALVNPPPQILDFDDATGNDEEQLARARATLASRFSIPLEAVQINAVDSSGRIRISSAYIFLSASDVNRLIS